MVRRTFCCISLVAGLLIAALASGAEAQVSPVTLSVQARDVGVQGRFVPGQWTGMRLSVQHRGSQPRAVICRWLLEDRDGDQVAARREVTLNPGRTQTVWLYAAPPAALARRWDPSQTWAVQVLDAESGNVLASTRVGASQRLSGRVSPIGVMGTSELGLAPFTRQATRHEKLALVRGLEMQRLPDRWYGLASLDALVWTRWAGSPNDQSVTAETQGALRQWVRRGGHLVISLPAVERPWADSQLADLLPVQGQRMRQRVAEKPPRALYPLRSDPVPLDLTVFDLGETSSAAVLARDRQDNPFIVAGRYGQGRVTLIGVDLTSQAVGRMGIPSGKYRIWHRIFRWQAPTFTEEAVRAQRQNQTMNQGPAAWKPIDLDRFIAGRIALRDTAAPVLLGAIVLFGLYWRLAGPGAYFVLRQKGLVHHSWLAFAGVSVVFLGIAWGGAFFAQSGKKGVTHFSVVTAHDETPGAHVKSWTSLFVPEFGRTSVKLGPGDKPVPDTLASPGLPGGIGGAGFTDQQRYAFDAGAPDQLRLPFRATARQFNLDYRGPLDDELAGLDQTWVMPQGELRINAQFLPVGELSHGLPGTLENVLLVFCPGDNQMPIVTRHGAWTEDELLKLTTATWQQGINELVRRPSQYKADRQWKREGFLGQLIAAKTGQQFASSNTNVVRIAGDELVRAIEMLTFYSALPPPNFRNVELGLGSAPANYRRTIGRALDLTHLTAQRRLILIGHLKNAPLPAPLAVDGETAPSEGWTVVRWTYDFDQES